MKLKLSEAVVSCCCCYCEGDQHFKGLRDKHINVCFCFKVHHCPFLALSFNLEPLEKTSNWSVAAEYDGQAVCPITFQTLHQTDVSDKSKGFLSWRPHPVRQATTAKSLISPRDLIHPVAQLWMMLISGDAAALVKGRPLLQAVVFLPLTPAFVIISCRSRQSTASPLSLGLRHAAKLLISHVTYDRPTRRSTRRLGSQNVSVIAAAIPIRLHSLCFPFSSAGTGSAWYFCLLAASLGRHPFRYFPAFFSLDRARNFTSHPRDSTQLLPLLCGCLMYCLYCPPPSPRPQSALGGAWERRRSLSNAALSSLAPAPSQQGTWYANVVACRADDIRFQIYVQPGWDWMH